jgi:hypothetical protein
VEGRGFIYWKISPPGGRGRIFINRCHLKGNILRKDREKEGIFGKNEKVEKLTGEINSKWGKIEAKRVHKG